MTGGWRTVVLGDLIVDIVVQGDGPLRRGTDVAGRIVLRQGGSAASTARVLARQGASSVLVTATGGDGAADALAGHLERAGVEVHAIRIRSAPPGRMGVIVEPDGERTFVSDRGPILRIRPNLLRAAWFHDARLLHLPGYSLLGTHLAATAERATRLARRQGARVSIDLASSGFLEDFGPREMVRTIGRIGPDLLLANRQELDALTASVPDLALGDLAPIRVTKEGARGARAWSRALGREVVLSRRPRAARDTTGAGDAFDAGFLAEWLRHGAPVEGARLRSTLLRSLAAAHRAAVRELREARPEYAIDGLSLVQTGLRREAGRR